MRCSGSPRNHGASTPLVKQSLALVSAWHGSPGGDWDGWWQAGQSVLVLAGVFQHLRHTQDNRSVLVSLGLCGAGRQALRSAALPWVPPGGAVCGHQAVSVVSDKVLPPGNVGAFKNPTIFSTTNPLQKWPFYSR